MTDQREAERLERQAARRRVQAQRPVTQGEVEAEIMRLSDAMELSVEDLTRYAQEAANAEVAFKVKYAKATLRASGMAGNGPGGRSTVDERESTAILECETELRSRLIAEAMYETCKEKMRTQRSQLDALRTVSANIRAQT